MARKTASKPDTIVNAPRFEASTNGKEEPRQSVVIKPLRERFISMRIVGTAPYMQMRFSKKAAETMRATQEAGQQAKAKKKREARNFPDDFKGAQYFFDDGSNGIPATAFRQAIISSCRLVGFKMTIMKQAVFVISDGADVLDGTPLVKITGKPIMDIRPGRNANGGTDLRCRPLWKEWSATVQIRFDEVQFSASDIVNLMVRVGKQVGIGEGRPDSKMSSGIGFGLFDVEPTDE